VNVPRFPRIAEAASRFPDYLQKTCRRGDWKHAMEWALVMGASDQILPEDLPPAISDAPLDEWVASATSRS
jgi:hypothetical protein